MSECWSKDVQEEPRRTGFVHPTDLPEDILSGFLSEDTAEASLFLLATHHDGV